MKPYYEPACLIMPESVDRDRMVIATYYVEDVRNEDEFMPSQAGRTAGVGRLDFVVDGVAEDRRFRERLTSKVPAITNQPREQEAIVQLGFPDGAWDINQCADVAFHRATSSPSRPGHGCWM